MPASLQGRGRRPRDCCKGVCVCVCVLFNRLSLRWLKKTHFFTSFEGNGVIKNSVTCLIRGIKSISKIQRLFSLYWGKCYFCLIKKLVSFCVGFYLTRNEIIQEWHLQPDPSKKNTPSHTKLPHKHHSGHTTSTATTASLSVLAKYLLDKSYLIS